MRDLGGDGGGPGGGDEEHGGEDEEVPPGEAGVLVKQNTNGEGSQRTGGAGRGGEIAAAEPGGDLDGELGLHMCDPTCGAGNLACSRLSGGSFGPCTSLRSRQAPAESRRARIGCPTIILH